ncbi:MAG: hypothetical protein HOK41_08260 [Nitrospina sp.]|nr:hypothetical protein [Nitrospina sp.]
MFGFLKLILNCVLFQSLVAGNAAFASETVYHQLKIEFEPSSSRVKIKDEVSILTRGSSCYSYSFYLHAGMKLDRNKISPGWIVFKENPAVGKPHLQKLIIQKNTRESCPDKIVVALDYSGLLVDSKESTGNSSKSEGFVFSGSDYFYPVFISKNSTVTFDMEVSLPDPWESVSQGKREKLKTAKGRRVVRWNSNFPSEQIFLIANRFSVYEEKHGNISLYAFLLQDESNLANRYIQTAKYYIDLYSRFLGPYPYSKFALVENARQTGLGMPSFTLMGSRIIRFPFILHSSYPHEILHNWWGNGVFADPNVGNWSEGLTAYLADHFLLEAKGKGSQYRFQEMMKYLSYVNESNEISLEEFSFRDSMASQAIGYGKLLMVFHMLRMELGERDFKKGLRKYYQNYKFRYAGYTELKEVFESVSGNSLDWFFEQWIQRKGTPEFELEGASYVPAKGRYDFFIEVSQTAPAYKLKLPVAIWEEGKRLPQIHYLILNKLKQKFHLKIVGQPQAVRLDPYNEVFRKLDEREVPSSIGQTYGAAEAAIVLPVKENERILQGYRKFAQSLIEKGNIKKTDLKDFKVSLDSDLSLWVFGKGNKIGMNLLPHLRKLGVGFEENGFKFKEGLFSHKDHSFIFTLPRLKNDKRSVSWIIAASAEGIPGLIRKLPHYGKYGYLVFKGSEPENVLKGVWPSNPLSLQKIFREGNFSLPSQTPLLNIKSHSIN